MKHMHRKFKQLEARTNETEIGVDHWATWLGNHFTFTLLPIQRTAVYICNVLGNL